MGFPIEALTHVAGAEARGALLWKLAPLGLVPKHDAAPIMQ